MENSNIPFKLFADCIPVKGYSKSLIVDLRRGCYYHIPNDLYTILINCEGKAIEEIISERTTSNKIIIEEYFNFLVKKELIFFTKTVESFPKINFRKWNYSSLIYQAILDVDSKSDYTYKDVFIDLDNLNCKYLQIRFFKSITIKELSSILISLNNLSITGVELYLQFSSMKNLKAINNLCKRYHRVNTLVFYNGPFDKYISVLGRSSQFNAYVTKQSVESSRSCGVVLPSYFSINILHFNKSINCNSCLQGKISLDTLGNIKNCPSMKESFGNIKNVSFSEVATKKTFQKYWKITKDKIKVCKDCEYRYICTDCRAYTDKPNDIYSKPLKCGYNPYSGKWKEWSGNPLKKAAIAYYQMENIL